MRKKEVENAFSWITLFIHLSLSLSLYIYIYIYMRECIQKLLRETESHG